MKGFIVQSSFTHIDEKTVVILFGRLENGQSFVSQNKIEPYFFVETSKIKKIKKYLKKFSIKETNDTNFKGQKVSKISSKTQTDLNKLHEAIHKLVDSYEADLKPNYRFLMDNDLLGNIEIEGEYDSSEKVDRIYQEPKITPGPKDYKPKLKVASIDIEALHSSKGIICIGIHSDNYKKNFIVTNKTLKNALSCKNESEVLQKFKTALLELDPDILIGWNFIDFDLKYLQERFAHHKIPFDIGRDNSPPRIRTASNFFRASTANISGRQALDAMSLIRDPFIKEAPSIKNTNFESYTLEDVSQAILGKGKLIKGSGKDRHDEIEKFYKTNPQKVVDYNLLDCQLVSDILEKTKIIDLSIERSQLTGLPFDRLTGSIVAFDSLYIREARKRGLVSPTQHFSQKPERITGGYVMEPIPGIYENVLVLDFKSLYPSILKTFNIDPASLLDKKEKGAVVSPNKVYFKNQDGILPDLITKLHEAREVSKKENRELSSYAIKIIMNSFWGVLASPQCRYFNFDMANAITGFARFIIQLTAKQIESEKLKVLYSDTDSVFVLTNLESKEKALTLGNKIQDDINDFYNDYTKKNYNRTSFLELELEKLYLSLMFPQVRGEKTGAKKRYAGLVESQGKEIIQITGLEAIRGDWTEAAQDFQKELLDKVFHKKEIAKFILSYINKLESGALDEKLIYKKSIRKALDSYTKTTPPHVKAARKLPSLSSRRIQYYITTDGPEPIQKLKHPLDYQHYIDKQIKPIAQQVLALFNKDFDDILQGSKQAKLF